MLNNNQILWKLRIALKLKDTDIIEILKLADFEISKSELSALFRREDPRRQGVAGQRGEQVVSRPCARLAGRQACGGNHLQPRIRRRADFEQDRI